MSQWKIASECCSRCAFRYVGIILVSLLTAGAALGDGATFDLTGPTIEMNVTRAGTTLPVAAVPNLQVGDRIWIHPALPDDQSVHYLLIVAFLRGTTNPPPENWFTRAETWNRPTREEGIVVTVPEGAQQALLFLAPETGGDFSSLRSAVRSKPGVFVRASQDLNQASLDRTRSDKYLADVKKTADLDPKALHDRSMLLARTLNLRIDEQCFSRPPEEQSTCLTQHTDQLVLDDGHSESLVAALTSGPSTDLMGNISNTSVARGGYYSPYVGAVVDLAKIMGTLHTAQYQYIPALSVPQGAQIHLRLNNPPSFRTPKSVLVVGLPAIEAAQFPPLRAASREQIFCLEKAPLVLPAAGAPLVFSTDIGHEFTLHIEGKSGTSVDLPAVADAGLGGFVIDTHTLNAGNLDGDLKGTLRGKWGFDSYEGPVFHLQNAHSTTWKLPDAEKGGLIVGRDDTIHLESACAACVDKIIAKDQQGKTIDATWKAVKPDRLEVHVPLKNEMAGPLTLSIRQFGVKDPDELPLVAYAEAAKLDSFEISAGDNQGILTGTRLDEVNSFELKGIRFVPGKLSRADEKDELRLSMASASGIDALHPDEKLTAQVDLKDGRGLALQTTVEPPRPKVQLISKSVQPGPTRSPLRLSNQNVLPQDGRMSFIVKSEIPETFAHTEKIEVANGDDSLHVMLAASDGSLMLQNSDTALAILDPMKSFGAAAFGPLRFRVVEEGAGKGDWQPLATLVRVPSLKEVRCPDSPDKQCQLSGSNLFLIDSVAADPQFTHMVSVPIGYAEPNLNVPRPNGTLLYIKLRDDPDTVDMLVLPVLPEEQ